VNRQTRKRLFFALNPGDHVRARIAGIQQTLGVEGRAVPPANFHITLAFLGMQEASVIPRVCEVASGLVFEPCELTLDQVGRFKRARVLWLGASAVPRCLAAFQQGLVDALLAAGIGYDRKPWKPHLTLYRKMRTYPPIMDSVEVRWRLNGFSLVESVSVNRGVVYHDIESWNAVR
jgi:2'-5' RNA ligase